MNTRNTRIPIMAVLLFSILIAVAGCLTTTATTERNFLRYENSDSAKVFQASMRALNDIGFSITASDANGGTITAERSAFTVGVGFYRFNIFVSRATNRTEVEVSFISPSMTMGKKDYVGEFVRALKERTPDVIIVTTATK